MYREVYLIKPSLKIFFSTDPTDLMFDNGTAVFAVWLFNIPFLIKSVVPYKVKLISSFGLFGWRSPGFGIMYLLLIRIKLLYSSKNIAVWVDTAKSSSTCATVVSGATKKKGIIGSLSLTDL